MLTTVVTHATGDVFPASDWNTGVRDNVNFLAIAGADLASATTITPTNETHLITGTTTIDNISTTGAVKGQKIRLIFQGAAITVRHIGGGTGNIRLTGGLHAGFVANETLQLTYDGVNWIESHRSPLHMPGESWVYSGPVGSVPLGSLVEDGSAISRVTYAAYFANVGTLHGVGDGSTTVNLPDSRGRSHVAFAPSGGHSDVSTISNNEGGTGNTSTVTLVNRRARHRTSMSDPGHLHTVAPTGVSGPAGGNGVGAGSGVNTSTNTTGITVGTGVAGDALDSGAYLVRAQLMRI